MKLGVRYPSSGGLITYLIEGFGKGRLVGIASWLGYIAAIVIVTAMVVVSFGGYATSLFVGNDAASSWDNVFITGLVVVMTAVNMVGAKGVERVQSLIVTGVLAVFAVFIVVTIANINLDLLVVQRLPVVLEDRRERRPDVLRVSGVQRHHLHGRRLEYPAHDLPRAMYRALGITSTVYVLIALGVFGTLTVAQVIEYGETAIAEAARPSLGDAGYTVMAVAALLSTAGATNATLYASTT